MLGLCISSLNAQTQLTTEELSGYYKSTSHGTTSIHDPSVVWDNSSKSFYIYGSHYVGANTKDFNTYSGIWNYYTGGYNSADAYKAFMSNPKHTVKRCLPGKTEQEEVELGSFDAGAFCSIYASSSVSDWVKGDQWAPDIIWNPTMKKWCLYLSLNGDNWASVVVLMTSDKPTGPFKYEAPIVFGGFNGQSYFGKSVNYKNTDLEVVLGPQSSLPSRYKTDRWGSYYPNCIDPCVFYDEEGELWIAYGSWSGGIFMLKLDKTTGLRDYTYTYSGTGTSPNANATSDAYFGKKIAGGYYVSGEGPYIQHIGDYYYLFMSYGGFAPDGGYEMRVFRSSSPSGPYTDASGNSALFTSYQLNYGPRAATNKGMKLIGAMNGWGLMKVGECAQGHNSACQDDKGRTFLVTHTKFNNGTIEHSIRVYQLYLNKYGWLVTAPFQFKGETTTDATLSSTQPYSAEDVAGTYSIIIHPYKLDHSAFQEATPSTITLSADGKVTGDYIGTWKYTDEGKSYISISLNKVNGASVKTEFNGVVVEQTLEGNTAKVLCFTTVCNTSGHVNCGVPLWGYKLQPQSAIAYNYQQHTSDCFKTTSYSSVSKNVTTYFDPTDNVTLKWTSSNPDVLSPEGKYNPTNSLETITLTAKLSCGDYFWSQDFTARALAASDITEDVKTGLVAYYNFDSATNETYNTLTGDGKATFGRASMSGRAPTIESDYSRFGTVAHQYFGANGNNSYMRIENPLAKEGNSDLEGFTVSLWVKRVDTKNTYDALWGFGNVIKPSDATARLFFTGNSYLGFNDNEGNWFDINHPERKIINKLDANWQLVTVTFSKENGYNIYRNGSMYIFSYLDYNGSTDFASFDKDKVLNFIKTAQYFYLGNGSFWGSAEAYFDDLMIYNRELSSTEVRALYNTLNRVNSFDDGSYAEEVVGIENVTMDDIVSNPQTAKQGIYDVMGRKVAVPGKGLYIVNGKKVYFK